ncbi:MAG TPA: zf-HC2 domain-containing protein [Pyrinomonadaceae bacterium]|jgi:anti-sigma factor RsiW|nr:zf-HC2 domain-containing protein [Pyrinomonadaceae bacterium]
MTRVATSQSAGECHETALTAPYLDGELDEPAARSFEEHARACPLCSAALLEQRRLLCLLDAAFDRTFGGEVPLPSNFTQELQARAENDMRGVRGREERRRALKICAALGAASFALLGAAVFDALLVPALRAARAGAGVAGMAGRAGVDAGAGAGLVMRALGSRMVADSSGLLALQLTLFAFACAALLLLIRGYHRRATARD